MVQLVFCIPVIHGLIWIFKNLLWEPWNSLSHKRLLRTLNNFWLTAAHTSFLPSICDLSLTQARNFPLSAWSHVCGKAAHSSWVAVPIPSKTLIAVGWGSPSLSSSGSFQSSAPGHPMRTHSCKQDLLDTKARAKPQNCFFKMTRTCLRQCLCILLMNVHQEECGKRKAVVCREQSGQPTCCCGSQHVNVKDRATSDVQAVYTNLEVLLNYIYVH